MRTSQSQRSATGFILIHGHTKEETPITWDWLTQRGVKPPQAEAKVQHYSTEKPSYSQKKAMLTELQPRVRAQSSFKIKGGFNEKVRARTISTAPSVSRSEKQLKPYAYLNSRQNQLTLPDKYGLDVEDLAKKIVSAQESGTKVIGVIVVRRMGLRFKFQQCFIHYNVSKKGTQSYDLNTLSLKLAEEMRLSKNGDRRIYFYHLSGQPLHSYKQLLEEKPKVILADTTPKLQIPHSIHLRVLQLGLKIENQIKLLTAQLSKVNPNKRSTEVNSEEEKMYDWQRIKSVRDYVNELAADPESNIISSVVEPGNQLISWYNQKYSKTRQSKDNDKNLLFESKSRFPNEAANATLLHMANQKVQTLPNTYNKHKFVPHPVDVLIENVRRELQPQPERKVVTQQESTRKKKREKSSSPTKKDHMLALDRKNSLLSTQNIPYLIEKYGLNRFELYNLYNLYKSFEKVALLKHPELEENVFEKGIDRDTFEVGLKKLDMNPGDELIKNICVFGDFISWEQFIKIISISLRKTPQEKLSAILRGISASDQGYLTKYQISLMIGSSLEKLFDHEEPQLRDYFTDIAMKELDLDGEGKVKIERLKEKVLSEQTDNLNMVSFLILNT